MKCTKVNDTCNMVDWGKTKPKLPDFLHRIFFIANPWTGYSFPIFFWKDRIIDHNQRRSLKFCEATFFLASRNNFFCVELTLIQNEENLRCFGIFRILNELLMKYFIRNYFGNKLSDLGLLIILVIQYHNLLRQDTFNWP